MVKIVRSATEDNLRDHVTIRPSNSAEAVAEAEIGGAEGRPAAIGAAPAAAATDRGGEAVAGAIAAVSSTFGVTTSAQANQQRALFEIDADIDDDLRGAARVDDFLRDLDKPLPTPRELLRRTEPIPLPPSRTVPAGLALAAAMPEGAKIENTELAEVSPRTHNVESHAHVTFAEPLASPMFAEVGTNVTPSSFGYVNAVDVTEDVEAHEPVESAELNLAFEHADAAQSASYLTSTFERPGTPRLSADTRDMLERRNSVLYFGGFPPSPYASEGDDSPPSSIFQDAHEVHEPTPAEARRASMLFGPIKLPPVSSSGGVFGAHERHASILFPVSRRQFEDGASEITPDPRMGAQNRNTRIVFSSDGIGSAGNELGPQRGWIRRLLANRFTVTVPATGGTSSETLDRQSASSSSFASIASSLLSGKDPPSTRVRRRARGTVSSRERHEWAPAGRRVAAISEASKPRFSVSERPKLASITLHSPAPGAAAMNRALERDWADGAHLLRSISARAVDVNEDDARALSEYFSVTAVFVEEYFLASHALSPEATRREVTERKARRDIASVAMREFIAAIGRMAESQDETLVKATLQAADAARQTTLGATSAEAAGRGGLRDVSVDDLGSRLANADNGKFLLMLFARGVQRDSSHLKRKWVGSILYPGILRYIWGPFDVCRVAVQLRKVHAGYAYMFKRAEREYRRMYAGGRDDGQQTA